ncbi:MAG: class I SAM-dependent rRNA methyltransferase, partial [Clostridia bacterium]|nr:class I SAM-dependent rRNA methyltransferase [Clostridia bacterium]
DYRKTVMGADFSACRLIFGEADGLPGWTVDRFENVLVTEVLSLGVEVRKQMLFGLLLEELQKDGIGIDVIYERNESPLRLKEGLTQGKGYAALPGLETHGTGLVEITENGIRYEVDYVNGQKTGFFLDQKYNRRAAARLATGKRVLDCFTHTGAFALNCAKAGAASVTAVDVSELALQEVAKNAALNGLDVTPWKADVFDLLTELTAKKCRDYDYIILDPPAFTKSNATAKNAFNGYKQINRMAMKLLPRGGYLATCSCSHFMYEDQFKRMLLEAAQEADVSIRFIEQRQQGPDHPILPTVPETYYLKFYLLQVI